VGSFSFKIVYATLTSTYHDYDKVKSFLIFCDLSAVAFYGFLCVAFYNHI